MAKENRVKDIHLNIQIKIKIQSDLIGDNKLTQ